MRADTSERFADMFRKVRMDCGKSQQYLADTIGVSKKTIQNWESGFSSPPFGGLEIFQALGANPTPYYLRFLYPSLEKDTEDVEERLITCIKSLSEIQKEKLLFLFLGDHGSSLSGMVELMTGHLQMPLRDRVTIANAVISNYDLASTLGELSCPDDVQPDIEILKTSLLHSVLAVKKREKSYSLLKKE